MDWLKERLEMSRGGEVYHVHPMEGIRGFAVFLVFLVHYVTLAEPWLTGHSVHLLFAHALHTIGNSGVDLFFVLSGYLIYGSLIVRSQSFTRFMYRRIERIYPVFLVVFAAYIVLSFIFPTENKIPRETIRGAVYLIQNILLLPGLFPIEPLITVAWSLSYEMFYYLTIPLVISIFGLRDRSAIWRIGFFSLGAAVFAIYCGIYGGPVRLGMFISGILLYETVKRSRLLALPCSSVGVWIFAMGLISTLLPTSGSIGVVLKVAILFTSFPLVCWISFTDPRSSLSRVFSLLPLRWLGNMSYSYYLMHGLTLKAMFLALATFLPVTSGDGWLFWLLLPVMFAFSLFPSAVLFLVVERPLSLSPRSANSAKVKAP